MKKPIRRTPRHKINRRQTAIAIRTLTEIAGSDAQAYVRAKAAAALLNGGREPDDALPERDPDAPRTVIFTPRKDRLPGQREDESRQEFTDRRRAWVEGRRAVYCEHIGIPYDPLRPLPFWPWPVPGSDPELEEEVDRRADEAEAAEVERQRAKPRPALVEILGPQPDSPAVIFDSSTPEGLADYERWKAEAVAAGHAIIAPQ